ncbi:hypothetical protein P4639_14680 [Priestia megaterium]|uniref:hypothetical protein n=1 Tax=Priestia megaterium TaxID=1404 RepID=UPI002E23B845|nr:hypothetical protein [Priestia megaterium]
MNYYRWKATNERTGDVYAFDEEEAKLKIETLFDVVVEDMELIEENVSRERIKGKEEER